MKTRLLKKLTKRFCWVYDHQNKDWVVIDLKNPLLATKPLKRNTYAELMASMELSANYISRIILWRELDGVFRDITKINKEVKSKWVDNKQHNETT